jgi:hypothetical protein
MIEKKRKTVKFAKINKILLKAKTKNYNKKKLQNNQSKFIKESENM